MAHLIDYSGGYPGAAAVKSAGFDGAIPCSVEGCDRGKYVKSYCKGHYSRLKRYGEVFPEKPLVRVRKPGVSIFESLDDCFLFDSNKGCYLWNKSLNGSGYPQMTVNKKNILVQRLIITELYGEIPPGQVVRHKCDVAICVNPFHIELGTQKENVHDMLSRGRGRWQK